MANCECHNQMVRIPDVASKKATTSHRSTVAKRCATISEVRPRMFKLQRWDHSRKHLLGGFNPSETMIYR